MKLHFNQNFGQIVPLLTYAAIACREDLDRFTLGYNLNTVAGDRIQTISTIYGISCSAQAVLNNDGWGINIGSGS